jgi:hypothetical protein
MTRILALLVLVGCTFAHAQTQQLSPAEWTSLLIQNCKLLNDKGPTDESQLMSSGYCMGYITGFMDGLRALDTVYRQPTPYCVPASVTTGQLIKVFLKYTDDHPEKLHYDSSMLMLAAITNAFPCSK